MTTWLPDSSATKCAGCKSNFSLLNRKHHCRTCGRVFCQSCSSKKIDLSHIGIKKGVAHRVCNYCFKLESKRKFWIEKACPALKIGSIVLHLGRFSSSTRILKLSEDEKRIEILEFESKKLKDSINIHHIKEVIEGKTTPHLKKSNQISALCFAILVNSSTYEFEAEKAQVSYFSLFSFLFFFSFFIFFAKHTSIMQCIVC